VVIRTVSSAAEARTTLPSIEPTTW
jgi:hypothetical protein